MGHAASGAAAPSHVVPQEVVSQLPLTAFPVPSPSDPSSSQAVAASPATLAPAPARSKGKARATPGHASAHGVGSSGGSAPGGKLDRRAVLERARAMRATLVAEVERAKVALWETTLEQGVLVGFGRELEKEKGGLGRTSGSR